MATTIQECASLSAAERRQRRKDRILGSANARLEKLLPGTTKAPSFDGDDDKSSDAFIELDTSTKTAKGFDSSINTAIDADMNSSTSTDITQEESILHKTMNTTGEIDYVEPSYSDLMDMNRVQACIIIGVMLRVLSLLNVINCVLPLWIPLSLTYHTYLLSKIEKKFPKHGYMVNFFLAGGINEKLVRYLGLGIDTIWSFMIDTLIMAFGFLSSHIVIFAVNLML